jgi:hypothetical protein
VRVTGVAGTTGGTLRCRDYNEPAMCPEVNAVQLVSLHHVQSSLASRGELLLHVHGRACLFSCVSPSNLAVA